MTDMDWSETLPEPGSVILSNGFSARVCEPSEAVLLSGNLDVALPAVAKGAPLLGLLETCPESGPFALRIARDRALVCSDAPLPVAAGWHEAGFAVSRADDLYLTVRIEGDRCDLVLAALLGTMGPSASAMTLAGESACLLCRAGGAVDIRVPRAEAAALWRRIAALAATV